MGLGPALTKESWRPRPKAESSAGPVVISKSSLLFSLALLSQSNPKSGLFSATVLRSAAGISTAEVKCVFVVADDGGDAELEDRMLGGAIWINLLGSAFPK